MKIIALQGSPNIDGSTAILVEEFARGAREAGRGVAGRRARDNLRARLASLCNRHCGGAVF